MRYICGQPRPTLIHSPLFTLAPYHQNKIDNFAAHPHGLILDKPDRDLQTYLLPETSLLGTLNVHIDMETALLGHERRRESAKDRCNAKPLAVSQAKLAAEASTLQLQTIEPQPTPLRLCPQLRLQNIPTVRLAASQFQTFPATPVYLTGFAYFLPRDHSSKPQDETQAVSQEYSLVMPLLRNYEAGLSSWLSVPAGSGRPCAFAASSIT